MKDDKLHQYRQFLKDTIRKEIDFSKTDQNRGVAPPPIQKSYGKDAERVALPREGLWKGIDPINLAEAIGKRRSRRSYLENPLTLDELAFLLWATQGIQQVIDQGHALRTVPSAGCRHALETYLLVSHVEGLKPGMYRYLPLTHQLLWEFTDERLVERLIGALFGQPYPREAAVTFIWTAIPYRMEWRYDLAAHRVIAMEAGHVCQNLSLACEAIGAGTCAIAAYDQEAVDRLLKIDGTDEFTIYLAPVGKVRA